MKPKNTKVQQYPKKAIEEMSYTPCTCGAFGEQLEFDFGPEFSNPASELCSDTNSITEQPSTHCEQDGFIGIKEDTV